MVEVDINLLKLPHELPSLALTIVVGIFGLALAFLLRPRTVAARPSSPASPTLLNGDNRDASKRVYAVINLQTGIAEVIVRGWDRAKQCVEGRSNYITVRIA